MIEEELFRLAKEVRERAHAPYSRYKVGAALRTRAGSVHAGANVENGAFPEGWCAETSAIAAMVAASTPGPAREIAAVAVVGEPIGGRLTTPCGGCRQRLAEFGGPDTVICVADPTGAEIRSFRLDELLPAAFFLGEGS